MMPRISFVKIKAPIDVPVGANLMEALLAAKIPVASSCHGYGICHKCVIEVVKGNENLKTKEVKNQELVERNPLDANCKLSCQSRVMGDITIDTKYW